MAKTITMTAVTALGCVFPGCSCKMVPSEAMVPSIDAMLNRKRQDNDQTRVGRDDLPKNAICKRHALEVRKETSIAFYPYSATLARIEREEVRRVANAAERTLRVAKTSSFGAMYTSKVRERDRRAA